MSDQERLEECIQYFKQRKVYEKLFEQAADKYRSLGHFGGTMRLSGLSAEECRQLSGFFRKDFEGRKTVAIPAAAMEKALEESRFGGLTWTEILQAYFGRELVGRREERQQQEEDRERFFARITQAFSESPGSRWLEEVLRDKQEGYLLLLKHYREQPEVLERSLGLLMGAISRLPVLSAADGKFTHRLLAVFAAQTTGDPHFFDVGTLGEQLLTCFLTSRFWCSRAPHLSGPMIPRPWNAQGAAEFKAEEKAGIFYGAGLLRDELSNHALAYGIRGTGKDGKIHKGMAGYLEQREPVHLTLATLGRLAQVYPQTEKRVYIVENPAVFALLANAWPEACILCGNGQIRLAMLVLLELFEADVEFWYGGDYDPEGLLIAQRLKERYGERLHFWKYRTEFYEKYHSDVEIPDKSLKKLERIYRAELQEIRRSMERLGKAAYQEAMLEEYLKR